MKGLGAGIGKGLLMAVGAAKGIEFVTQATKTDAAIAHAVRRVGLGNPESAHEPINDETLKKYQAALFDHVVTQYEQGMYRTVRSRTGGTEWQAPCGEEISLMKGNKNGLVTHFQHDVEIKTGPIKNTHLKDDIALFLLGGPILDISLARGKDDNIYAHQPHLASPMYVDGIISPTDGDHQIYLEVGEEGESESTSVKGILKGKVLSEDNNELTVVFPSTHIVISDSGQFDNNPLHQKIDDRIRRSLGDLFKVGLTVKVNSADLREASEKELVSLRYDNKFNFASPYSDQTVMTVVPLINGWLSHITFSETPFDQDLRNRGEVYLI